MNSTMPRLPTLKAPELQHAGVALGEAVELGDVLGTDQHGGVLVVGVDRRHHADAAPCPDREGHGLDRHPLVLAVVLGEQAVAGDRVDVALDLHAEHVLEGGAEVAGDEAEGIAVGGRAVDDVDRVEALEAALEALDQARLAGADRAHEVEHLARLLAAHGRGVEIADDLLERPLHAEELVLEEIVDLDRLVAEHPLGPRVGLEVEIGHAPVDDHVVHAAVGEVGEMRLFLHQLEIFEEGALPFLALTFDPVVLDQSGEIDLISLHAPHPLLVARHGPGHSREDRKLLAYLTAKASTTQ
jgi:hypothetical protein